MMKADGIEVVDPISETYIGSGNYTDNGEYSYLPNSLVYIEADELAELRRKADEYDAIVVGQICAERHRESLKALAEC